MKAVEETFNFKLSGLSGIPIPESWKRIGSTSFSGPLQRVIQPFWYKFFETEKKKKIY